METSEITMWAMAGGVVSLLIAAAWAVMAVVGLTVVRRRDSTAGLWTAIAGGGVALLILASLAVGMLPYGLTGSAESSIALQMRIRLLISLLQLGALGLLIAAVLRLARARAHPSERTGAGGRELS